MCENCRSIGCPRAGIECHLNDPITGRGKPITGGLVRWRYCRHWACETGEDKARQATKFSHTRVNLILADGSVVRDAIPFGTDDKPQSVDGVGVRYVRKSTRRIITRGSDGQLRLTGQKV